MPEKIIILRVMNLSVCKLQTSCCTCSLINLLINHLILLVAFAAFLETFPKFFKTRKKKTWIFVGKKILWIYMLS